MKWHVIVEVECKGGDAAPGSAVPSRLQTLGGIRADLNQQRETGDTHTEETREGERIHP